MARGEAELVDAHALRAASTRQVTMGTDWRIDSRLSVDRVNLWEERPNSQRHLKIQDITGVVQVDSQYFLDLLQTIL